jgi:low affinity Fe/Cu permease
MAAPKHKTPGDTNGAAARLFGKIANRTSQAAGRAITFLIAVGVVLLWAFTGPIFNYSDTWQLVINTAQNSFVGIEHLTAIAAP